MKVELRGVAVEEFADSEGFESLGCKLSAALGKIARGHIGRIMTNTTKAMAKRGVMIMGRQLLHLMSSSPSTSTVEPCTTSRT